MTSKRLLATGAIGTIVAAVCCGAPVLAIVLGPLGLSAWLAYDDVILPALVVSLALTDYALHRRSRRRGRSRV